MTEIGRTDEWKLASEAVPDSGRTVLGFIAGVSYEPFAVRRLGDRWVTLWHLDEEEVRRTGQRFGELASSPTHWRELPDPPPGTSRTLLSADAAHA